MVELRVFSSLYCCTLSLERRITYIRGDSGIGKTSLLNVLDAYENDDPDIRVELNCDRSIYPLVRITRLENLDGFSNSIVFLDDSLFTETEKFGNRIVDKLLEKDIYLVIINRVDIEISRNHIIGESVDNGMDYSVRSILICKKGKDDINHYYIPITDLLGETDLSVVPIDMIIVEDAHGLTDVFKYYNLPVKSSCGKENIVKALVRAEEEGYKHILVFADSANFGRNFDTFLKYSENYNIYYDCNYECFEYVLLVSNMLKDLFNLNIEEANSCTSWEKYFEVVLLGLTEGKFWQQSHGKQTNNCYYKLCEDVCHPSKSKKCSMFEILKGDDKLEILFKGTLFEYIWKIIELNKGDDENVKHKEY